MTTETGITREEFNKLAAPFASKDHEFNRGFIYIEETAVCSRIEDVDLCWEWKTIQVTRESDVATVVGALTIKGVTRYGTGQQVVHRDKEGRESVGEATKGATTDALKRAARLFGIGRYLLQCPKTVKDYGQDLDKWLASITRGQTAPQQALSVAPAISDAPVDMLRLSDRDRWLNFLAWAKKTYSLEESDVMAALYFINHATFKEAPAAQAKAAIEARANNRKVS